MLILQEGFRYHHAEPDYLMLVCWLPETTNTIPQNASHRVGVGAFVMNNQREVFFKKLISGFPFSLTMTSKRSNDLGIPVLLFQQFSYIYIYIYI